MTSAPSLSSLPTELIQRIACFCDCSTVFALLSVNHTLHVVCDDRHVFGQLAENISFTIPDPILPEESATLVWKDAAIFMQKASLLEIKRIAHAAETAIRGVVNDYRGWTKADVGQWMLQLIAMRHPAALLIQPYQLAHLLFECGLTLQGNTRDNDLANIAFCTTALALSWFPILGSRMILHSFMGLTAEEDAIINPDRVEPVVKSMVMSVDVPALTPSTLTFAQAISLTLPMIIRFIQLDYYGRPISATPSIRRMPFHTFMDIPDMYQYVDHVLSRKQADSATLNTCHIDKMLNESFLSGEWAGYYADAWGEDLRPLRLTYTVELLFGPRDDEDEEHIRLHLQPGSRGRDTYGHFTLAGHVDQNGHINGLKTYSGFVSGGYMWSAFITPLGIVGMGKQSTWNRFLWLWKKEWIE